MIRDGHISFSNDVFQSVGGSGAMALGRSGTSSSVSSSGDGAFAGGGAVLAQQFSKVKDESMEESDVKQRTTPKKIYDLESQKVKMKLYVDHTFEKLRAKGLHMDTNSHKHRM